ncbi:MAG: hypothetical protein U0Q03_13345 [Acidimicrobiales bacterium]
MNATGTSRRPVFATSYVVLVMVLTAVATADPNEPRTQMWLAAMALCLPALVPALPLLYVVLSIAWNVTNADDGGSTWPLTVVYVIALGGAAVANVALVRGWWHRRARSGPVASDAGATMR